MFIYGSRCWIEKVGCSTVHHASSNRHTLQGIPRCHQIDMLFSRCLSRRRDLNRKLFLAATKMISFSAFKSKKVSRFNDSWVSTCSCFLGEKMVSPRCECTSKQAGRGAHISFSNGQWGESELSFQPLRRAKRLVRIKNHDLS